MRPSIAVISDIHSNFEALTRDGDNRACYVVYRPGQNTVEFRRVAYDIARTKKKILRAKLPRFTAHRLSLGR